MFYLVIIFKGGEIILSNYFTTTAEPKQIKATAEYSNLEQSLIKKVQCITERVLSKPKNYSMTKCDEDSIPKSKRRAANSEEDIVQAITGELNFPQYRKAYIALVDYFDLAVPGNYSSSSQFSTESERKCFLKSFAEALYQKLHWER